MKLCNASSFKILGYFATGRQEGRNDPMAAGCCHCLSNRRKAWRNLSTDYPTGLSNWTTTIRQDLVLHHQCYADWYLIQSWTTFLRHWPPLCCPEGLPSTVSRCIDDTAMDPLFPMTALEINKGHISPIKACQWCMVTLTRSMMAVRSSGRS